MELPHLPQRPRSRFRQHLTNHFNGAFSIRLPEGWHVNERDDGILVSEPNGGALIDVLLINTGNVLNSKGVKVYVDSVETNFFRRSLITK